MSELIIRTENQEALQKIADFLKSLGFEVVLKKLPAKSVKPSISSPVVNDAAKDFTDWASLAGIWKDNPLTAEELRLKAWGGRL